jgi:hypothetical protein
MGPMSDLLVISVMVHNYLLEQPFWDQAQHLFFLEPKTFFPY